MLSKELELNTVELPGIMTEEQEQTYFLDPIRLSPGKGPFGLR
jgi:hypothetical protein